jgi:hypothetical protein
MSKVVNGRKPLSSKPQAPKLVTDDIFGNTLAISSDLQKELTDQGLIGRWVSSKVMRENQGYHPKGWKVYKRKTSDTIDTTDFLGGQDPSGVVRRGDCVLAVKTTEEAQRHREYLAQKAARLSNFGRTQAQELKELAKSQGVRTHISEGYEDSDDDNEE